MIQKSNHIELIRHSLSHVLAAVVKAEFPDVKFGIGPAIENGFYYDFELPINITSVDLLKIEDKMKLYINKNILFNKKEIQIKDALEIFKKSNQTYKIELIEEIPDKTVTLYETGDFTDLCKGPHIGSTEELKNIGWKLDKTAGAYWRGNEKNKMLQRIYGLAFNTKEELNEYLINRREAAKRDHKKIGRDMDLFSFHPEAPGMPFWHEKGMIIWNLLADFGQKLRKKNGFVEIKTPIIAKNTLWKTSGHWGHYKDSMFSFDIDKETYCIKPMDCPFNIKIYQTKARSYKEMPIRYTEIGHCHRHEKSGELNGLLRVQEITQDDSHIFVIENQIKNEIKTLIKMIREYYKALALEPNFFFSTRPDDYMGEIALWDKAEQALIETLKEENIIYELKEKDGAFYGPKIDVDIRDSLGRPWQVATIQLDFQLPRSFNCEYIDEDGKHKNPMIIHAAIFGSFERMIGILLEHTGGALPSWLSPIQTTICPISEKHIGYAKKIVKELSKNGIRFEIDIRNESVGRKIRDAELQKVPFIIVIGDKEINSSSLSIRTRGDKALKTQKIEEFIQDIMK